MASHFSDLGFPTTTQEDVADLVMRAATNGTSFRSPNGTYICWSPGDGIELWVQTRARGRIVGYHPHFSGTSRMRVGVAAVSPDPDNPLEGSLQCWADPVTDNPESDGPPLVLDLPNFDLVRASVKCPSIVAVQIAAFARELRCYQDDAHFDAGQTGRTKFAPESFFPSGMFTINDDQRRRPDATAIFAGHLVAVRTVTNAVTGARFHSMSVRTLGGMMDVVADPVIVVGEPIVGGVAQGTFWLSGRIVDASGAGPRPTPRPWLQWPRRWLQRR